MSEVKKLSAPFSEEVARSLKAGDQVALSGVIYTGRDTAHKRMMETLDRGEDLPFPLSGAVIFYVGPTPPPPGRPIGSAGPTTSGRMDAYAPRLIALGLRGMIGKGNRSKEVREACVKYGCVYLGAIGGAGALLSNSISAAKVVAWEELGPEAVRELQVKDMPLVVINDCFGADLYEQGRAKFARK
ncbi:MAG TPA: Fe-S-containing hydro-lyase [bacterium]|nr:Fe-S-containing hydro-lyase [bacterium]